MKKGLQIKLIIIFFAITLVSAILSVMLVLGFYSKYRSKQHVLHQERIAQTILLLGQQTDLTSEEIIEICIYDDYQIKVVDDTKRLTAEDLNRLEHGELVLVSSGHHRNRNTLFFSEGTIYEIIFTRNKSLNLQVISVLVAAFFISLVIGTIITSFVSKIILEPVRELMQATKDVAGGDFNVRVSEKRGLELKILARNFNTMVQELGSIETLRNDFISNVSHEFKTPIASIQGFAKLLQSDEITQEEKKEYTDVIMEETARLTNLSTNILKLSKLDNQKLLLEKNEFNLAEQMRRCILLLEQEWSRKKVEMIIELDEIMYYGNEELLQQVWINLISNAVKFSKEKGMVSISMTNRENSVIVRIEDQGCGMDEETIKHIFDKFYQGDKARNKEGNGLGLALVKKIIDLCKGTITVHSNPEKGSSFQIELPHQSH